MTRACGSCEWFVPHKYQAEPFDGTCRFTAPLPTAREHPFAQVTSDLWCREHTPKDSPCDQTTSGARSVDTTSTKAVDAKSPSHTTTAKSDRADAKDRSEPSAPPPVEPDRLRLIREAASYGPAVYVDAKQAAEIVKYLDSEQRRCAELEAIVKEYRSGPARHDICVVGHKLHGTPFDDRCDTCKKADALPQSDAGRRRGD